MMRVFLFFLFIFLGFSFGWADEQTPDELWLGPIYNRGTAIDGSERVQMLGPVYETREYGDESNVKALRPFFSREIDPSVPRRLDELFWPFAMYKGYEGEVYWRVLTTFGHRFPLEEGQDEKRYRTWVFPFIFAGRTADGKDYLSVFPLGGTLHEFLG